MPNRKKKGNRHAPSRQNGDTRFLKASSECWSNGKRLLENIEWLNYSSESATCFALATIAQEEFAKAFLLILVSRGVLAWNSLIYRATRDHECKQLLGIVMEHLEPEDFFGASIAWNKEHRERMALYDAYKASSDDREKRDIWSRLEVLSERDHLLPAPVADSINIFRHEKIRRWESPNWWWGEPPKYNRKARKVAAGDVDRKKQDALYVRLSKTGAVAKTPSSSNCDARGAVEVAKRFESLVGRLLQYPEGGGIECDKVENAFKMLFSSDAGLILNGLPE